MELNSCCNVQESSDDAHGHTSIHLLGVHILGSPSHTHPSHCLPSLAPPSKPQPSSTPQVHGACCQCPIYTQAMGEDNLLGQRHCLLGFARPDAASCKTLWFSCCLPALAASRCQRGCGLFKCKTVSSHSSHFNHRTRMQTLLDMLGLLGLFIPVARHRQHPPCCCASTALHERLHQRILNCMQAQASVGSQAAPIAEVGLCVVMAPLPHQTLLVRVRPGAPRGMRLLGDNPWQSQVRTLPHTSGCGLLVWPVQISICATVPAAAMCLT